MRRKLPAHLVSLCRIYHSWEFGTDILENVLALKIEVNGRLMIVFGIVAGYFPSPYLLCKFHAVYNTPFEAIF